MDTYTTNSSGLPEILKSDVAVLDYTFDWSEWLATDTISSYEVAVNSGITVENTLRIGAQCTVWLSGGIAGKKYKATCTIHTTAGRTERRAIMLSVVADR